MHGHSTCQSGIKVNPRNRWPKRVLAVGEKNDPNIRVCETSTLEFSSLAYITLSHCWGHFVPTQLLIENCSGFLQGIETDNLPSTFKDAVEVTKKLEIGYLWIDSLCIIQNSPEDWANESSKMDSNL